MFDIWFWQRIVSPHMVGLATSLARLGHKVTYVVEEEMSTDRAKLGWQVADLTGIRLRIASDKATVEALVREADASSIHVCQGIRANGLVSHTQRLLAKGGLRQWVVMETIDDAGVLGILKRIEYARLFQAKRQCLMGVLATGHSTSDWVVSRGMPNDRVFSFAYFLPEVQPEIWSAPSPPDPFRFIFVGQFIALKRLDLLVSALSTLLSHDFELVVVGSGPLEEALRSEAERALPGRVRWVGRLPYADVPAEIARADCLVLPSRHDGWGAVVSEALMVGTPAICSDTCGVAGVVQASGVGGVFKNGSKAALRLLLDGRLQAGRVPFSLRSELVKWATALGSGAGATYLSEILKHRDGDRERPIPPWLDNNSGN